MQVRFMRLIQPGFNHCYELVQDGVNCFANKSLNVVDWEGQNDECFYYECQNDTGIVPKNRCGVSMKCVDDKCINQDEMKEEWTVVIDIYSSNTNPVNLTEVKMEMSTLANMSMNDFEISVEYDNDGRVVRVIVYVNDETSANEVKVKVDNLDKGDSCEGILCNSKETHVQENTRPSFTTS